jgi:hypothetical protein
MLTQADSSYNERLFQGGIRSRFHLARFHWLESSVRQFCPAFTSVIELGCYDGRAIYYLPKLPASYVGFDADWEQGLQLAEDQWSGHPAYWFHKCKVPEQMVSMLGNQTHDIAICLETLEHLPPQLVDPYMAVLSTATNKYAFLTVPNEKGLVFLAKYLAKRLFGEVQPYSVRELLAATAGRMQHVTRDEHKGFDYQDVIRSAERYFAVVQVAGYPFPWLPLCMNFGVGIVAASDPSGRARARRHIQQGLGIDDAGEPCS